MRQSRRAAVVAAAAALVVASPTAALAGGDDDHGNGPPVRTVASGLDGPRQLSDYEDGKLLVAESDSGEVSSVDPATGEVETLLSGLVNVQGVDHRHGLLFVAVGESAPPEEGGPVTPVDGPAAVVIVAETDGDVVATYDLKQYELDANPDRQVQFVGGAPADALSNPFGVLAQRKRILVADGGGNDVVAIDRKTGEISTFFVPPTVTGDDVAACGAMPNNEPGTFGCDSVPTEITEGPDGLIYVGTLGSFAPGAGRVYVLDQDGDVVRVIEDLTAVTGVAVDHKGAVYVSNLLEGAPMGEGPPPPGFDPAAVGELVRIDEDDTRTTLQVTMPVGLEIEDGQLYSTAWSAAGMLDLGKGKGEVVAVDRHAFE